MKLQNIIPAVFLTAFVAVLFLWFFTDVNFRLIFTAGLVTAASFVSSICVVALPKGYIRNINFLLTVLIVATGIVFYLFPGTVDFSLIAIPAITAVAIELCLWEVAVGSGLYRGRTAAVPLLAGISFVAGLFVSLFTGISLAFASTAFLVTVVLALLGILFGYKKDFNLDQKAEFPDQSTYDPKA